MMSKSLLLSLIFSICWLSLQSQKLGLEEPVGLLLSEIDAFHENSLSGEITVVESQWILEAFAELNALSRNTLKSIEKAQGNLSAVKDPGFLIDILNATLIEGTNDWLIQDHKAARKAVDQITVIELELERSGRPLSTEESARLEAWKSEISAYESPIIRDDNNTVLEIGEANPSLLNYPLSSPSDKLELEAAQLGNPKNLWEVYNNLTDLMRKGNYGNLRFFPTEKGGFCLVTRLEQIDHDHKPLQGDQRWSGKIYSQKDNFIIDCLRKIFFAQKGYFRLFIFEVNPPALSYSSCELKVSMGNIPSAIRELAISPPNESILRELQFNDKYKCRLNMYYYKVKDTDNEGTLEDSDLVNHLKSVGIKIK